MSKRDEYPAGVPCWVETLQPDPRAALGFYRSLLGWEFSEPEPMPDGLPGEYFIARVEGHEVAGIGALPDLGGPPTPAWSTYVRVGSVDAAVDRATSAGGSLLVGPLDAFEDGRLAVLGDRAGATFCVWEARDRAGAQLVNEPRTWAMSSLHTPDPGGASAFYGSVFGWQAEAITPGAPVTLFRLPGYVGGEPGQPIPRDVVGVMTATGGDPAAPAVPPHWNVNLRVDDTDAVAVLAAATRSRSSPPISAARSSHRRWTLPGSGAPCWSTLRGRRSLSARSSPTRSCASPAQQRPLVALKRTRHGVGRRARSWRPGHPACRTSSRSRVRPRQGPAPTAPALT